MSREERRKLLQQFYEKARPKRPAYRKRNKLSSKPADESSEKLQKGKKRKNNSSDRDRASEGELAASKPADDHASDVAAPESLPLMCGHKEPFQFDAEKLALLLKPRTQKYKRGKFGRTGVMKSSDPYLVSQRRSHAVLALTEKKWSWSLLDSANTCGDLDSVAEENMFFVGTSLKIAHHWRQQTV